MASGEERANELVARYIISHYREENGPCGDHLSSCPDITVTDADASDGSYGCDTGCEYVRFEAVLTCPHGESEAHEFGEFGELTWILEDLEKQADVR